MPEGAAAPLQFAYDARHLVTEITNAAGATTTFAYDRCRRVTQITTPEQEITRISYPSDQMRVVTDARQQTWTLTLDSDRNITQIADPAGIVVSEPMINGAGRDTATVRDVEDGGLVFNGSCMILAITVFLAFLFFL